MMTGEDFDLFFEQVYRKRPFPWQRLLAREALQGTWPDCIALPTAAGKTALIDIAVFALAAGAPGAHRRIFFVVDRRVVVDEAAQRAQHLSEALRLAEPNTPAGRVADALWKLAGPDKGESPLYVGTLRGGIAQNDSWARSPLQPSVCCSTVDQVGSSLLFRAYSARSPLSWPIRAGLVGNDALLILDEAHTAHPFLETVRAVERYQSWSEERRIGTGIRVIEMSATPRSFAGVFRETEDDRAEGSVLGQRWGATKPARLVVTSVTGEGGAAEGNFEGLVHEMTRQARRLEQSGAIVIGVVANRVATARKIHQALLKEDCRAELLIGRSRPFDRDAIWQKIKVDVSMDRDSEPAAPVYVVATQCIEVGANLDFDGLVTEVASIDALEQRFGRLNRRGRAIEANAAIVAQKDQTGAKYVDAVYGQSLVQTWRWLLNQAETVTVSEGLEVGSGKKAKPNKVKYQVVNMGVDALRSRLLTAPNRDSMTMPTTYAPVLLPAHVDRLSETSPEPAVAPEPALFLHGPQSGPADVQVLWRGDLTEANGTEWASRVCFVPPRPEEMISLPVWTVRRWLNRDRPNSTIADVEGQADNGSDVDIQRPVLVWRGPDDTDEPAKDVRPGQTIVVPSSYGGCDRWGWNPDDSSHVEDVADQVAYRRQRPTLRLHPALVEKWEPKAIPETKAAVESLRYAESDSDARRSLRTISEAEGGGWYGEAAALLLQTNRLRRSFGSPTTEDGLRAIWAVSGRVDTAEEEAFTEEVELETHLKSCESRAASYAAALGLPAHVARTVAAAARWHDIGKSDPRFQSWLRGGIPVPKSAPLWAKSGANGQDRAVREAARVRSGYAKGIRHELQSVALLASASLIEELDWDLLLHLVGSHHGWCRPFAPPTADESPRTVVYRDWSASSDHGLARLDSGVSERFWRLTRRYGWWGLAYLEMILRLTDHRVSEAEQKEKEEVELAVASS
jgi:CRISPR-associated endonuclease/helicase Cas3